MTFLEGFEYAPIYIFSSLILIILRCTIHKNRPTIVNYSGNSQLWLILLLSAVMVPFIGYRPANILFPDTAVYTSTYDALKRGIDITFSKGETFFYFIRDICISLDFSSQQYLMTIAGLYLLLLCLICRLLFKGNEILAFLFFITGFGFYSDLMTLIRNGLAMEMTLFSMAILCMSWKKSIKYTMACLIGILAFYTHKSVLMPLSAMFLAYFLIKDTKISSLIWIISIFIALIIGPSLGVYISDIMEDERLQQFTVAGLNEENFEGFSHSGFRWDFLLYSFAGIIMCLYVTIVKGINDNVYNFICNTFILTNAAWITLIYSTFSDRFARLSWAMMPIVFLYPLVYMNIWNNPNNKITLILLGQWLFISLTFLSQLYYFYFFYL